MNEELASRIRSTENVVLHLKPIPTGMSETGLADLLWKTCGIAFSPQSISIRENLSTGVAKALILVPRDVMANWLHACINPSLGIEVEPARKASTRTKVLTGKNGNPRLVRMERNK